MQYFPFLHLSILGLFAAILISAAIIDARSYKIPNSHNLALILLYPAYYLTASSPPHLPSSLILAAIVFGVSLLILYRFHIFGAGDCKMLIACSLWVGTGGFPEFVMMTALAGGVLAIGMFLWFWRNAAPLSKPESPLILPSQEGSAASSITMETPPGPPKGWFRSSLFGRFMKQPVPYGVAIAAGCIPFLLSALSPYLEAFR